MRTAFGRIDLSKKRRKVTRSTRKYIIRDFSLDFPESHVLPQYQAKSRLYDRFLLILGDCLSGGALVADIGANVGDSLAALCGSIPIEVICVEGSPTFFNWLERNAQLIRSRGHMVTCINAIVGPKDVRVDLVESGSTGRVAISTQGTPTTTLDEIFVPSNPFRGPTLIKVDTDGFDAAVIGSGECTLRQHEPLLYWENTVDSTNDLNDYLGLYDLLNVIRYDKFTIFDNFGNIILETNRIDELVYLARYTVTLSLNLSDRTIYYTDILASTNKHREIHDKAVSRYRDKFLPIR